MRTKASHTARKTGVLVKVVAAKEIVKEKKITRGQRLVQAMRGRATIKNMSTDEILSITRGRKDETTNHRQ